MKEERQEDSDYIEREAGPRERERRISCRGDEVERRGTVTKSQIFGQVFYYVFSPSTSEKSLFFRVHKSFFIFLIILFG